MKKLIYIFIFTFVFFNSCVNAELDWSNINELNNIDTNSVFEDEYYSVNYDDLTHQPSGNYFYSKEDSASLIGIDVQQIQLGDDFNYHTIYNQEMLSEIENTVSSVFKKDISSSTLLKEQSISTFAKYPCFSYQYEIEMVENYVCNCWYYIIFSDNYRYEVAIFSYDESFINNATVSNFINSFKIKDTTNICTPTVKNEIAPSADNTTTSEFQSPYADYTLKDWIVNILFTAIIYLFFPILIKLIHKEGFKSSTAFWISFSNFFIIKFILSLLINIEFNTNTAWLYLIIAHAILTNKNEYTDSHDSKPLSYL